MVADSFVYPARRPQRSGSPPASRQARYQRSNSARISVSSGSLARLAAPRARRDVAGSAVSGSSDGAADTFRPTPTITASPTASARIPPSLASPTRTSFGHFSRASTAATVRTAPATAAPASSGSQPRRAGGTGAGRNSSENVRAARGGDCQERPIRPRPADCSSAARTTPSGAPSLARASRSALVEPVEGVTSRARHRPPGRSTARRSAAASRAGTSAGAGLGVWVSARMVSHYCSCAIGREFH
jgi:hypothetical protein